MKKLFLAIIACVCVTAAQAQTEITIGPKLGWNITNISNMSDSKNKMSVSVGGFAEFKFNDYVALQPELLYSRQGFRLKDGDVKTKVRVNYLNIPILAKLYVLEGLSVDLGPQLGFALNAKNKSKSGGTTVKHKITNFNTCDVSFAVGLSYEYEEFMVSARYNIGLTNVFDKDDVGGNNKNHVFQLSVGYRFGDLF